MEERSKVNTKCHIKKENDNRIEQFMTPQRELNRFPCRLNCSNSDALTQFTYVVWHMRMTFFSLYIFHAIRKPNIDYYAICSSCDYYVFKKKMHFFGLNRTISFLECSLNTNSIELIFESMFTFIFFFIFALFFGSLWVDSAHMRYIQWQAKPISSKLMIEFNRPNDCRRSFDRP